MKKRITGIIRVSHPKKKKMKIKGWKINPYIFMHKRINTNYNPVRHSNWTVTHIPTGLLIIQDVKLSKFLTIKKVREIVNRWFPVWLIKQVKKDPENNITKEMKVRAEILRKELHDYKQKMWEI